MGYLDNCVLICIPYLTSVLYDTVSCYNRAKVHVKVKRKVVANHKYTVTTYTQRHTPLF